MGLEALLDESLRDIFVDFHSRDGDFSLCCGAVHIERPMVICWVLA
jgi:hypothetical protein